MDRPWWRFLKIWSTGKGIGKLLQHSCFENPMNSMKRQKDMTLKDDYLGEILIIVYISLVIIHLFRHFIYDSLQFSSVTQSCLTLCDPMNTQHARPPCPSLPQSTQTHVHCVGDAIQSSHPLSSPSPPALNLSQHQGLFQ